MKKIFLIAVVSTMTLLFAADMREDAILKRIQHLGSVCTSADCGLKTSGPGWKVSTSMFAAPMQVADASGRDGKTVYEAACTTCHAAGMAGAPKFADASSWGDRPNKGLATLTMNVKNGLNAMPAMGLCMDCTDAELEASVQYMLDAL